MHNIEIIEYFNFGDDEEKLQVNRENHGWPVLDELELEQRVERAHLEWWSQMFSKHYGQVFDEGAAIYIQFEIQKNNNEWSFKKLSKSE